MTVTASAAPKVGQVRVLPVSKAIKQAGSVIG